jgi:hypothetical protein
LRTLQLQNDLDTIVRNNISITEISSAFKKKASPTGIIVHEVEDLELQPFENATPGEEALGKLDECIQFASSTLSVSRDVLSTLEYSRAILQNDVLNNL